MYVLNPPTNGVTYISAANSQDRCSMQGCIAEASTKKPTLKHKTITDILSTSVHYDENEWELSETRKNKIDKFLSKYPAQKTFYVTGYTDACGSHRYNIKLSQKRANEVFHYVRSKRAGTTIILKWVGEVTHKHTSNGRKVSLAIKKKNKRLVLPPKIIADFYLLDGSGSMSGKWKLYTDAIAYWRPKGSRVYVSNTGYIPRYQSLKTIVPFGKTEIWFAYWSILDKMKPGQKLIIISDFDSTIPISAREQAMIKKKVHDKGVKVRAIRL